MGVSPPTWIWPEFAKPNGQALRRSGRGGHPFGAAYCGSESIPTCSGRGRRDYFAFPGGLVGMHSSFRAQTQLATTVIGEDFLKFHFKLSGDNVVRFSGCDEVRVPTGSMAIAIQPRGVSKLDAHSEGASEHSLTFACLPSLFTETLQFDPDALPQPIQDFASGRDPALYLHLMPLSSRIRKTVEDMLSCPYSGRLSHIHAEARALDLICITLDALINNDVPSSVRLTPRDVATLEAVREALRERCMDPPTIAQLSRQTGINRTKLTQGFQYLFNETMFDYCHRMRMQRARELLLKGLPVGTVALDVGYEHHSSFAQAFRSYYGFSPAELRRRGAR